MRVNLFVTAEMVKKLLPFCAKAHAYGLKNTIMVQKYGEDMVQFAATDGQKLLVFRRKIEEDEKMETDPITIPVENLPIKKKGQSYWLTVGDEVNEAVFNDAENVYRFKILDFKYPDINHLMEPLYNAPYATEFTMFKSKNIDAAEKAIGYDLFNYPKKAGNVYMWEKHDSVCDVYVIMCPMRLEKKEEQNGTN